MDYRRGVKRDLKPNYGRLLLVLGVLLLIFVLFWVFFSAKSCNDKACFDNALVKCKPAFFTSEGEMIFRYKIVGKQGESCMVDVWLLKGEISNQDSLKLENQNMRCYIPLGFVSKPESDISLCHGLLKEGLQDLIISRLHNYVVQNLGKIHSDALGFS